MKGCKNAEKEIKQVNLPTFRGVYIAGHSAGAHLAAMVMSTNWEEVTSPQAASLIKGNLPSHPNHFKIQLLCIFKPYIFSV